MEFDFLDKRPIIIAIAGSNGAGKSTFYETYLSSSLLPFINADIIARDLDIGPYEAAQAVDVLRRAMVAKRESFIFETVFSDPVGDKVQFLKEAGDSGYEIVLIFIRIPDPETSIQRVSMRVAQGEHDVPDEKLESRFARTLANLELAIQELANVMIFDNSDLSRGFQHEATYRQGGLIEKSSL